MNIGIVLPHLGPSQLSYCAIQSINNYINNDKTHNIFLFYEQFAQPCTAMLCGSMHINEAWCFNGLLITSTISNTMAALKSAGNTRTIFYVNDLEWTRPGKQDFMYNIQSFRDANKLISRCDEHTTIIKNYSGVKAAYSMPLFDINEIIKNET